MHDPMAEDNVAQASPIGTMGPPSAIRLMISGSPASWAADAEKASFATTAT